MLRKCRCCGKEATTEEELDLFVKRKECRYDRDNYCKECSNEYNRRYAYDYEKDKAYKFKYAYGITLDEYSEMFKEQQGCCLICDTQEEKLVVDHNHETGEVRGLLCNKCNSALGFLKDNPKFVLKAYEYLVEKGNYALFKGDV